MQKRKPNVEFINKLRNLVGARSVREFARLCGKAEGNMSKYLSGKVAPGDRVLQSCIRNIARASITWEAEREGKPLGRARLPTIAGIYILYDSGGNVVYIGKASDFSLEVNVALNKTTTLRVGPKLARRSIKLKEIATHVSLYMVEDPTTRHNLEALLLRVFANQTHNVNIGKIRP